MKGKIKCFSAVVLIVFLLNMMSFAAYAEDTSSTSTENAADTAAQTTANANSSMPVEVKAKAAVLMDASTGNVLMSMNPNEKLYPASVTKIMTLLLVTEAIDNGAIKLSDQVKASKDAVSKGGSQIWLKEGEVMTVDDLLKAASIGSANDACVALADYIAGSEQGFVVMMNERAKELGMKNTTFENCTGLDDTTTNHFTTAYDIALMSRELLKHERITNYTTVWMDSLRNGQTELVNTNKLVRFYEGTTGLKTGTTSKAGFCVSASAARNGSSLIAVVLGSDNSTDRFEGAKAMMNWGFANYTTVKPEIDKNLITDVNVLHGVVKTITPKIPDTTNIMVETKRAKELRQKVTLAIDVEAPIEKGQVLGTIEFTLDDKTIAKYNLISQNEVERISFTDALVMLLRSLSK